MGGEVRGNYCTLNPLSNPGATLANGNLDATIGSGNNWYTGKCTIAVASGKWYFEQTINSGNANVGISATIAVFNSGDETGSVSNSVGYKSNGQKGVNGSFAAYGASYTSGDVIGCAFDMDAGSVTFYKNGVSQSTITNCITAGLTYTPVFSVNGQGGAGSYTWNFGQRAFAYTAPSGFKALVDTNLPSTTITTSGSYTGNGVADGPFVYLNGVPTAMTIGGNAVTFGTHADKLANGFKIRTSSTTYNQNALSYNYSITSTGAAFKNARAQPNP